MAGVNHHHVWQMLQRGFGTKRGKDHHVWVYEKGKPPRQTVTRLFGADKYFYGPEGSQADINITKYENDNQSIIQEIRKLPNGSLVDTEFSAILISHLEMRSSFLRDDASDKMQKMMNATMEGFKSPKDLRKMMLDQLSKNPDVLNDVLPKLMVSPSQKEEFLPLAKLAIESMSNDEIESSFSNGFGAFSALIDEFPKMMRDGQNKALSSSETYPERANIHRDKVYSVLRLSSGEFILPDTTLAFFKKNGASPFVDKDDNGEAVILPIASDVAILGRKNLNAEYSLKAINRILAGCSFKAFIAREQNYYLQGLTARIGRYAKLLSDRDVKKMVKSAIPNYK